MKQHPSEASQAVPKTDQSLDTASPAKKPVLLTPLQEKNIAQMPSMSPFKSPNTSKLTPLPKGSGIVVPKRRKLSTDHLATPTRSSSNPLIPQKSRSFSTPIPRRVPSLTETPIPELTPPTCDSHYETSFVDADVSMVSVPSPTKKGSRFEYHGLVLEDEELEVSELVPGAHVVDEKAKILLGLVEKLQEYELLRAKIAGNHEEGVKIEEKMLQLRVESQRTCHGLYRDYKKSVGEFEEPGNDDLRDVLTRFGLNSEGIELIYGSL